MHVKQSKPYVFYKKRAKKLSKYTDVQVEKGAARFMTPYRYSAQIYTE